MAPRPERRRAILGHLARLYEDHRVSSTTRQSEIVAMIVEREMFIYDAEAATRADRPTDARRPAQRRAAGKTLDLDAESTPAEKKELKREATKKLLARLNQGGQPQALWTMLLDCARLPAGDSAHVDLGGEATRRLDRELAREDQAFVKVSDELGRATQAGTVDSRLVHLKSVSAQLDKMTRKMAHTTSSGPPNVDAVTHLHRVSSYWAEVFDVALTDDELSQVAQEIAEHAIEQGHRCGREAINLTPPPPPSKVPDFGSRMAGDPFRPPTVDIDWLSEDMHWVMAYAVLRVRAGTSVNGVVRATSEWAARHLEVDEIQVSKVNVLTQAGWTLMRTGRRDEASSAVQAAWRQVAEDDPSVELLDLSALLAGVLYSHGDARAAKAVMPLAMVERLERARDDEWWGEWWSDRLRQFGLYVDLQEALTDPYAAVSFVRETWLRELSQIPCNPSTNMWVLTGVFVELLIQCHDQVSAATVARVSLRRLVDPADANERKIKAHLSEMSIASQEPHPKAKARVQDVVNQLCAVVLAEPGTLDREDLWALEGMVTVVRAELGLAPLIVP